MTAFRFVERNAKMYEYEFRIYDEYDFQTEQDPTLEYGDYDDFCYRSRDNNGMEILILKTQKPVETYYALLKEYEGFTFGIWHIGLNKILAGGVLDGNEDFENILRAEAPKIKKWRKERTKKLKN